MAILGKAAILSVSLLLPGGQARPLAVTESTSIITATGSTGPGWSSARSDSLIVAQSAQPDTRKPPAGAAQWDSGTAVAIGHEDLTGTIEGVTGIVVSVRSNRGRLKLKFADDVVVGAVSAATLTDIKPGTILGINGDEIYILPSKGPLTVEAVQGQVIKATYGDLGNLVQQDIAVTPRTSIFKITHASKTDLMPGAVIFSSSYYQLNDGTIEVHSLSFGKDGIAPHMSP